MIIEENLPLKYVVYNDYYGCYIGFKDSMEGDLFFCSCMYESIENYIQLRLEVIESQSSDYRANNLLSEFILRVHDFPLELVKKLVENSIEENSNIINHLNFKDQICHRCNKAVPNIIYCHPMYGGSFTQKFGWYIKMKMYELGLREDYTFLSSDNVPIEIIELIDRKYPDYLEDLKEFYAKEIENLPFLEDVLNYLEIQYQIGRAHV